MSLSDPGYVSSALNFATLANPARSFYGAAAASSGVSQIVAGSGVTVSPAGGTGVVTVSASGSSSAVNMASTARVPYQQQVETVPSTNPITSVNGVIGITCPVGAVTTGGYATFSCTLINTDPTDPMNVIVGIFTGSNTPPINIIDQQPVLRIPPLSSSVLVSRTFPLVNMTGDFIVQAFVVQQVGGFQEQNNFVKDPTLSVTWGGTATIEAPPS